MDKTVSVHVTGRVQGVSFRAFTRDAARDLGLAGWVRNEADGSVRALVSGPKEAVDALCARLAEGPAFARVDAVETAAAEPFAGDGFGIRR